MGNYLNGEKLLKKQASLVETWTIIGESGLMQLGLAKFDTT